MAEENGAGAPAEFKDPIPVAMILCEGISREILTDKLSLLGLFGAVITPSLPAIASFYAHATLTNIRSSLEFKFMVVDENGDVIYENPEDGWTPLEKPGDIIDEAVAIGFLESVEFSRYGSYFVQLWTKKRSIMERVVVVSEAPPVPEEEL